MRRSDLVPICLALLFGVPAVQAQTLIPSGATWSYEKGRMEPSFPVTDWRQAGFDDSLWRQGPAGIGYGDGDDATVLADMQTSYVSVYMRRAFDVPDPAAIKGLVLNVDYDDGFVAYLNGVEVARRGLDGEPVTFTRLARDHEAGAPEDIPLSDAEQLLVAGRNVLAIQVHNSGINSSDLSMSPSLSALPYDPAARGPYLQRARPDEVLVRWSTTRPSGSTVEYGDYVQPFPAAFPLSVTDPTPVTEHAVLLSGLAPGSHYMYRVAGDGEVRSADSTFWTLVRSGARVFDFAVAGDSGTGELQEHEIGRRMREHRPDFWLHVGDLVADGAAANQDQQVFVPFKALMAGSSLMPAMGDEDLLAASGTPAGQAWRDAFSTFANNPARDEAYYSFDVGHAHVLVLDTSQATTAGSPQGDWLRQDLATSSACWKFVSMHQPLYTSTPQFSDPAVAALRADLAPVFEGAGVDVVFSGHVRAWERSHPVIGGTPRDAGRNPNYPDSGPIYVVTGGGGEPLDDVATSTVEAAVNKNWSFAWVTLADGVLTVSGIDRAAVAFDTFTVTKTCSVDADGDTVPDTTDDCPFVADPGQANLDGDATGDACDPDVDGDGALAVDDCDDRNAAVSVVPAEVTGLRVAKGSAPDRLRLAWDPGTGGATARAQLVTGDITPLLAQRDFRSATCAGVDLLGTSVELVVAAGSSYWLVRSTDACGAGTWGDSSAAPDPRDALDSASPCP